MLLFWFGSLLTASLLIASSVQDSHLLHGPITKHGFAIDIAAHHRAEFAAVVGRASMVAQDEIGILRNHGLWIGPGIQEIRRYVGFRYQFVIHKNVPISNADAISGKPDDPLDKALARV